MAARTLADHGTLGFSTAGRTREARRPSCPSNPPPPAAGGGKTPKLCIAGANAGPWSAAAPELATPTGWPADGSGPARSGARRPARRPPPSPPPAQGWGEFKTWAPTAPRAPARSRSCLPSANGCGTETSRPGGPDRWCKGRCTGRAWLGSPERRPRRPKPEPDAQLVARGCAPAGAHAAGSRGQSAAAVARRPPRCFRANSLGAGKAPHVLPRLRAGRNRRMPRLRTRRVHFHRPCFVCLCLPAHPPSFHPRLIFLTSSHKGACRHRRGWGAEPRSQERGGGECFLRL